LLLLLDDVVLMLLHFADVSCCKLLFALREIDGGKSLKPSYG